MNIIRVFTLGYFDTGEIRSAGRFEDGDEQSVCVKGGRSLDQLYYLQLPKSKSVSRNYL
jgi:hypothetical protein